MLYVVAMATRPLITNRLRLELTLVPELNGADLWTPSRYPTNEVHGYKKLEEKLLDPVKVCLDP